MKSNRYTDEFELRFSLPQDESLYWECAERLRESFTQLEGVAMIGLDVLGRTLVVRADPNVIASTDLVKRAKQIGLQMSQT